MEYDVTLCKCKKCGKDFSKMFVGRYPNTKKKYVDEFGQTVNGRLCGGCSTLRVRLAMRDIRKSSDKHESA